MSWGDADALLTLKSYYRKRPQAITEAERMGVPIYVLRSNTVAQMEGALVDIFGLEARQDPFEQAIREAQEAIEQIRLGGSRHGGVAAAELVHPATTA